MIDNKSIRKVIMLNKILKGGSPTYEDRVASGAVANFTTNTVQPFVSVDCEILPKQSGTGNPSPDNPRPISGTSVLNVEKTGKNLFPFGTVSGTTYAEKSISLEASTYTLSVVASGNSSTKMRTIFQYTDNSYGGECLFEKDVREAKTVILTKPAKALLFYAADTYPSSVGFTFEYSDIQLELGSTATTYEPYTGTTYPIALGQTVYGGSAEVVEGSGSNNKTARVIDGTEAWFLSRSGEYTTVFALGSAMSVLDQNEQICSHFKFNSQAYVTSQDRANTFVQETSGNLFIQVSNDLATTVEGFKSWLASEYANGTPVSYVANTTPTPFTFTGQEINSLEGVNNVWADTGDTEVTYKYKTGEGGSSKKKYLPIFYDLYGKDCRHL